MILNFQLHFNTFCGSSFQTSYDSYIHKHHQLFLCPNSICDHSSILTYSTSYSRYIFLDFNLHIILKVAVFKCPSCNSYHAILPSFLLPYSSYSLPFIIKTLYLYFFHNLRGNKSKVCQFMHISRKVLNHFLSLFSQEEIRCLHHKMMIHTLKQVIGQLHKHPSLLPSFLSSFSKLNMIFFFLPSHRNSNFSFFNSE